MNAATQGRLDLRKYLERLGALIELEEHMKEHNRPPKIDSRLGKKLKNLFRAYPWKIWQTWQEIKESEQKAGKGVQRKIRQGP